MKKSSNRVFVVDEDVNEAKFACMFNEVPSLNSHPVPSPNLVVGSPSRTRSMKTPLARPVVRSKATPMQTPVKTPARSLYNSGFPNRIVVNTTPKRPTVREPKFVNNNSLAFPMSRMSLMDSQNQSLDQFDNSMLSTKDYHKKIGRLNDVHEERQDCPLIAHIVDNELGVFETIHELDSATVKLSLLFLKSQAGSKYVRDMMMANNVACEKIVEIVVQKKMVTELALSPMGNFIVQKIPGVRHDIDKALCEQLAKNMFELTMNKYGCRVIQVVISFVHSELVKKLVGSLRGHELQVCLDSNGTHVVQVLLGRRYQDYEGFFAPIIDEGSLHFLVEDKLGCRIIQSCLGALAKEVTTNFVPPILNKLIIPLLIDAKRYSENEFANYVMQNIIQNKAFARQRDYIIDQVLLGNLLRLSQGKFSSHVVEAALESACRDRLGRMCREIFHDYKIVEKGLTPIEVLLFDQYGNYIMQKLLLIAIEVCKGIRQGDPNWMSILAQSVIRNRDRLSRYSSGKKILALLNSSHPGILGQASAVRYRR